VQGELYVTSIQEYMANILGSKNDNLYVCTMRPLQISADFETALFAKIPQGTRRYLVRKANLPQ